MVLELVADSPTDEELVRSALAGHAGAFDRLVERHAARVFRIVRAQVEESVAEDLVQDTFLRAFVALPKFEFGARFSTWLFRIMLNETGQYLRKKARRHELDARARQRAVPSEVSRDAAEARELVWRALGDLPEEYRTALLLREWGQLSYAEIAQVLGCPVGTVDSRIARARRMLAERLGPR